MGGEIFFLFLIFLFSKILANKCKGISTGKKMNTEVTIL